MKTDTRSPVRYTYDCEFLEDGRTIDLISIGIVCLDDGRELYAINAEADWHRILEHEWLPTNVVPHLPMNESGRWIDLNHPNVMPYEIIARNVLEFFYDDGRGYDEKDRELWAYYAAYDHVALCQLYGPMSQLPGGVPRFTRDIKDWAIRLGSPKLPEQVNTEHSAIDDAWHNRTVIGFLGQLEDLRHVAP